MTETPTKIYLDLSSKETFFPDEANFGSDGLDLYHHDAEVQRLVAEARAEAFEEAANVVGDRRDANTAIWEKTGNPGWLAVLAHLDQARDAIRALSDAPPRQVTPQKAAKVLLSDRFGGYGNRSAMQAMWDFVHEQHGRHMLPVSHYDGVLQAALRALANGGAD